MKIYKMDFPQTRGIIASLAHKWIYNSIYEFCAVFVNEHGHMSLDLLRDDVTLNYAALHGSKFENLGGTTVKEFDPTSHFIVVTMKQSDILVFILAMPEDQVQAIVEHFEKLEPNATVSLNAKTRQYYGESLEDRSAYQLLSEQTMTSVYPARLIEIAVFPANGYTVRDVYPEKPVLNQRH